MEVVKLFTDGVNSDGFKILTLLDQPITNFNALSDIFASFTL